MSLLAQIKQRAQEEAPSNFAPFADKAALIKSKVGFYILQIRYRSPEEVKNKDNTGMYYLTIQTLTPGAYGSKDDKIGDEYTLTFGDNIEYRNVYIRAFAEEMAVDMSDKDQTDSLNPFGPIILVKQGKMIIFEEHVRPGAQNVVEETIDDDLDEHPF